MGNLTVIPYGFVFLYPQLREAADESTDDQSAVYRILARYRLFMVGLILSLFVYNFLFYAIVLIIYLILVNGAGKSPQTANTVTAIVIAVIGVLMVRYQTRIKAVVNHIYNYFKKAEDNAGFRYGVAGLDVFSRYSWLVPAKTKQPNAVINAFKKL